MPRARGAGVDPAKEGKPIRSTCETTADANGEFQLTPFPASAYTMVARAPAGKPYHGIKQQHVTAPAPKGSTRVELALPRGRVVRGQVVEAGTGQPVANARVHYFPQY